MISWFRERTRTTCNSSATSPALYRLLIAARICTAHRGILRERKCKALQHTVPLQYSASVN